MSRLVILEAVRKAHPTTVREICTEVGLSTATVWHHLETLKAEGEITWEKGKARTIRPT